MRKMLLTLTAVFVLMGISAVSSWSQHGHGGKEVTITGEVIGTVCYVRHDAKGEKHKTCALACAKQGIPLGILAVFAMNLVRVISLFYLGEHYPDFFREVHVYVWQPIIILWAIVAWDYWTRQVKKMEEAKARTLSD